MTDLAIHASGLGKRFGDRVRMSRIRVLIADDQPLMRAGFKTVLEATGSIEVIAEAGDGEEAIRAAEAHAPEVVLMDIRMPKVDGIEATRRLPRHRVLILTTIGLDEYIVEALRAGASGFLLKDARPQELVGAVRAVAAGDAVLSTAVTRSLLDQIAHRLPAPVAADGALSELTERELEVRAGVPTPRSLPRWWSPKPRSRATSPTCSASSGCATACRR
jgi:DNA-binding NarL/FixJ family response regulator